MARTKPFQEILIKYLKDPKIAVGYLNEIIAEYKADDKESQELLLLGLKDIAQAHGGIANLAEKTGLGRESLYKTLSSQGNPRLSTLKSIAHALGFKITFTLAEPNTANE